MKKKGKKRLVRLPILAVGTAVMLFSGIIYAWSILNVPFRIIELADGSEVIMNSAQLGINYSLLLVFFCLGNFSSGLMSKQTSVRLRFILSGMLLIASFYLSSLHVVTLQYTQNYFMLVMAYAMLGGLGIGMTYNTVVSTVTMWYPEKRGFSSGILLMSFGLSALIVGSLVNLMGQSEAIGWRNTYVTLAFVLGGVLLLAAIVIKPPPSNTLLPEPKSDVSRNAHESDGEVPEAKKSYSTREMIRRPSFILIFIYITFLTMSGSVAIGFGSEIVYDVGGAETIAVIAVGMIGIFNGAGRLICGALFDKAGIRQTQLLSSAIAILAPLVVVTAITADSLLLGVVGLSLCGLTFGFAPTTGSVFASEFYGTKNFAQNFSILGLILIPASFSAALAGTIRAASGSFMIAFIILTALAVAGFFINLGIRKP